MRTLTRFGLMAAAMACSSLAPAHAAEAADEQAGAWTLEGGVTIVSDYRFRGVSLADHDPAVQPELTLSHESGFYIGLWGSNIADNGGTNIETDPYIGYSREFGPITADINAMWYLYPGASEFNYIELNSRLSMSVAGGEIGASFAWAPSQHQIGGISNRYYALDASLPVKGTPLSLSGSFGIEDGAFGDNKRDWSLGLTADVSIFTLGASYVDSARNGGDPLADAGAVFSIAAHF